MRREAVAAALALPGLAFGLLALPRSGDEPVPAAVAAHAAPVERAERARAVGNPSTERRVVGPVLPVSRPVDIEIPAIDVRSPLQRLGLTADGALEVPAAGPRYDQAGWYRHSPTPGALGPAVVVGHLDSATGEPSVFYRLAEVEPGDRIRIRRADGSVAVFAVDDVRRYPKSRFPTDMVYGDTDHAALRLITCGGAIGGNGHYLDNVVVRASLVA